LDGTLSLLTASFALSIRLHYIFIVTLALIASLVPIVNAGRVVNLAFSVNFAHIANVVRIGNFGGHSRFDGIGSKAIMEDT
jgi:hypothetical protein